MALPIRRGRGGRSGEIQAVQVTDFSGGLNLEAGQFNLRKNEVAELVDMDVVGRGGVRRRKAIRYLLNNNDVEFGQCPRSVWTFEASDANRYTYIAANAAVADGLADGGGEEGIDVSRVLWWSLNGGPFTAFTGSDALFGLGSDLALMNRLALGDRRPGKPLEGVLARAAVARDTVYGVWAWRGAIGDRPNPFKISSANTLSIPNETGCALGPWTETYLDYEVGSDTGVVNGQTIAYHYGQLFVGNTIEGDPTPVRYKSRLRWSHPGDPERWREDDWIDIDVGKDGDQITALVPFRDHLLIFKNGSVHALYGDSPETFTVVNLSNDFGCLEQEGVVATPFGVFFFDQNSGVWQWDGSRFVWRFENMNSLLRENLIPADERANVSLGWVNNRLWVGVPYEGESTERGRTLVYDPAIGQNGVWCEYTVGLGPFASIRKTDDSILNVAGCSGTRLLQMLEQPGDVDAFTFTGGGVYPRVDVNEPIVGSFRMPWLDMKPGSVKQWKRPDVVVSSRGELNLKVEAFFDYVFQAGSARKTFSVSRTPEGGELDWADETNTDLVNVWDGPAWANEGEVVKVARGATVGRGVAMTLRFTTPAGAVLPRWSVDGVTVKFKTKRVRG
jgi:hypothetical protein